MVKVYVIDEMFYDVFGKAIEDTLNKDCTGMANLIVNTYVETMPDPSTGDFKQQIHYVAVITDNIIPSITMPTNQRRIS